jgi:hypothetical protein
MFESKASRELKTERTRKYVSISIRGTTQLPDIRWGFEITSKQLPLLYQKAKQKAKHHFRPCTDL